MEKEHLASYQNLSIDEVLSELQTTKEGLSIIESEKRIKQFGENNLQTNNTFHYLKALLQSVKNPFSLILVTASILSLTSKNPIDACIILAVLITNTSIDIYHQKTAHKNIQLLKKGVRHESVILRDGKQIKISSLKIVPGDIVCLEEGDTVPADGRLIETNHLIINESSLTGESLPVQKDTQRISGILSVSDLHNMAWCGSAVIEGSGKFVTTQTGFKTRFGNLNQKLQETERGSNPFLERIKKLSKTVGIAGVCIVAIIFSIHIGILGTSVSEIIVFSLAVLVSIIPESLPTIINITLARGARNLAEEHAVVKELSTIESIGSTTIIITDKTGTLTENSMRVEHIVTKEDREFQVTGFGWKSVGMFLFNNQRFNPTEDRVLDTLLDFAILSNRARVYQEDGEDKIIGEPTEAALLVMAEKAGKDRVSILKSYNILQRTRFLHTHKVLVTIVEKENKKILIVIGAPETIWQASEVSQESKKKTEEFAHKGMRTIACAYSEIESVPENYNDLPKLSYLGFVAMRDPIREGVKETIEKAKYAGVRVIMATGDHLKTAKYIAEEIGIIKNGNKHNCIEGLEFLSLSEKEQKERLKTIQVFARVTPEVKLLIIQILQKNKEIVTMIGDGVNDTLALKQADVGVAMGNAGTDAARNASSIVLTNDNFITVVHAIFRGRHVFRNIQQVTNFLLSTNAAEALVLIIATFIGFPLPLIATQILLINLVTDGIGALPFAFKKPSLALLPKQKSGILLTNYDYGTIASATLGMTIATLVGFGMYLQKDLSYAQSIAFLTLSLTQIARLVSFGNYTITKLDLRSNPWFLRSIGISLGILVLVFNVPDIRTVFHLEILQLPDVLIAFLLALIPFATVELYKIIMQTHTKKQHV